MPALVLELIDKVPDVNVNPPEKVLEPEKVTVLEEALMTTAPSPEPLLAMTPGKV